MVEKDIKSLMDTASKPFDGEAEKTLMKVTDDYEQEWAIEGYCANAGQGQGSWFYSRVTRNEFNGPGYHFIFRLQKCIRLAHHGKVNKQKKRFNVVVFSSDDGCFKVFKSEGGLPLPASDVCYSSSDIKLYLELLKEKIPTTLVEYFFKLCEESLKYVEKD